MLPRRHRRLSPQATVLASDRRGTSTRSISRWPRHGAARALRRPTAASSFLLDLPEARPAARRRPPRSRGWDVPCWCARPGAAARDRLPQMRRRSPARLASRQPPPADPDPGLDRLRSGDDHVIAEHADRAWAPRSREIDGAASIPRAAPTVRTTAIATTDAARCYRCWPGCRPPTRSAPTATATGWNGRSRRRVRDRAWPRALARDRAPPRRRPDGCRAPRRRHRARRGSRRLPRWMTLRELADALAADSELALETLAQGAAFVRAPALPPGPIRGSAGSRLLARAGTAAYPLAVGVAAAAHGLALDWRCPPICRPSPPTWSPPASADPAGPDRRPVALAAPDGVDRAARPRPRIARSDDLGTPPSWSTCCSMRHETQYTRLFRS